MTQRLRGVGPAGRTLYGRIISTTGLFFNGSDFETYSAGNVAAYTNEVTELGSQGIFDGEVPALLPAGRYDVAYFIQAGAAPADTDRFSSSQVLQWYGVGGASAIIPLGTLTGALMAAYIIRSGWRRDDMEDELYDAITDTILEMEQRFQFEERQVETTMAATLGAGEYKLTLESDLGHLVSLVVVDGDDARRLTRISKSLFDLWYPSAGDMDDGYPEHFALFGGYACIGPRPDQTSYRYRLSYSTCLTETVDASTDPVPFTAKYREVVKDGTLARLFENLKNHSEADRFRALFNMGMDRAETRERRNRGGAGVVAYSGF